MKKISATLEKIVDKDPSLFNMDVLFAFYDLKPEQIKRWVQYVDLYHLVKPLDEEQIMKYIDYLDCEKLCRYQDVPESVLKMYPDKFDMRYVSHQDLSEDYIREHADQLDWATLLQNGRVTYPLLIEDIELHHRLSWEEISQWHNIDAEFADAYHDKIEWCLVAVNEYTTLDNIDAIANRFSKHQWLFICYRYDLTIDFIRKHQDKLNRKCWQALSKPRSWEIQSDDFVREFSSKIDFSIYFYNQRYRRDNYQSDEIYIKFSHKIKPYNQFLYWVKGFFS